MPQSGSLFRNSAWRWATPDTLGDARVEQRHEFTPWFDAVFDRLPVLEILIFDNAKNADMAAIFCAQ